MAEFIRSTAKAIVLHEGRVLLNRAADAYRGDFYALPGGGQHRFETLEDAVVRECLEETGYRVRPLRLAAVCEEIWRSPAFRAAHPEYAHRMLHIFLCALAGDAPEAERRPSRTAAHTASNGCPSARWAAARLSLPR